MCELHILDTMESYKRQFRINQLENKRRILSQACLVGLCSTLVSYGQSSSNIKLLIFLTQNVPNHFTYHKHMAIAFAKVILFCLNYNLNNSKRMDGHLKHQWKRIRVLNKWLIRWVILNLTTLILNPFLNSKKPHLNLCTIFAFKNRFNLILTKELAATITFTHLFNLERGLFKTGMLWMLYITKAVAHITL